MRTLVLALTALALLTLLPAPAQAQQSAALTMTLAAPDAPLTAGALLSFHGVVTYTADYTAALSLSGTPVSYTVSAMPEWASVVVSPANDVFPGPNSPGFGLSYTATRMITITVTLARPLAEDASGAIEITAVSRPGMLGQSATGKASAPILYDAPDEPCDEAAHSEELLALAREAADAYAKEQATQEDATTDVPTGRPDAPTEDLTVQNTGAQPLGALPWIGLAGFALVGAGVGLVLRKRFR